MTGGSQTGSSAVWRFVARVGLAEERRARRIYALSWPRILTGFARVSQRTADLIMVGIAVGSTGVAGLAFAFPYWELVAGVSSGLTNSSISLISQRFGANQYDELDVAVKQVVWISLVISLPIAACYWFFAAELIGLFGGGELATAHGTTYLRVIAPAVVLTFLNKVGSRILLSADDAWTPMVIRGFGALLNIVLNAVFIFGFGLGILGAALGTVIATGLVTVSLAVGLLAGWHPGLGRWPVKISPGRPYLDVTVIRQLLEISIPLMIRLLITRVALFPLLVIVTHFGTVTVAAYEISRRVRSLVNSPSWGLSLAASSLVGQELGKNDETEAEAYGWDLLRIAIVTYVILASGVFLLAHPIAFVFVQDPETVRRVVPFIRIISISVIWLGVDEVTTGTLRAGGDTRWPMYGRIIGLYLVMLPLAFLGTVTPLGLYAVYAALIGQTAVPAIISFYRFHLGTWKLISRSYRATPGT